MILLQQLTEGGTYPQLPTQPKKLYIVQTDQLSNTYCHSELPGEEKSKFESEEKCSV